MCFYSPALGHGIASPVLFVAVLVLLWHTVGTALRTKKSGIPCAHWTCSFSGFWILLMRYRSREIRSIHDAHQRLGPVVRLAPKEVSVNCVEGGIKTIYTGGFEKHEWYQNLFFNYGVPNMFAMSDSRSHSMRKRMLSNIYSKSYIQSSPAFAEITHFIVQSQLLPLLEKLASDSEPFDVFPLLSAATMDFVTSYLFGLSSSSHFLENDAKRDQFLARYTSRQSYNFYPQELPFLTWFLAKFGIRLVPKWVDDANQMIETWTMDMCDKAARLVALNESPFSVHNPAVYSQLKSGMTKMNKTPALRKAHDCSRDRLDLASEVLDHLAAGFDTSGITLLYFIHEISQRPDLQASLRQELMSLENPLSFGDASESIPTAKHLDQLLLLDAMLKETLRLRAAIPGPEPRITPVAGCYLGPRNEYFVAGGVRVSAQAHSLHRNPKVFEDPELWIPQRWIHPDPDKLRQMDRWFWAFSSGGRMCIGSNLAMYQMKYIIAAFYSKYETCIVDDHGIEQRDIYTAPPKSGRLVIKLTPAQKPGR